jgi:hypothetical protein
MPTTPQLRHAPCLRYCHTRLIPLNSCQARLSHTVPSSQPHANTNVCTVFYIASLLFSPPPRTHRCAPSCLVADFQSEIHVITRTSPHHTHITRKAVVPVIPHETCKPFRSSKFDTAPEIGNSKPEHVLPRPDLIQAYIKIDLSILYCTVSPGRS